MGVAFALDRETTESIAANDRVVSPLTVGGAELMTNRPTGTGGRIVGLDIAWPGDVVSGDFEVVVKVEYYDVSCDLYGKPGLLGVGRTPCSTMPQKRFRR